MPALIGAIDSGTTSTRFMLFDAAGNVVAHDQREHRQIFPQSGWVEHDPLEIWERTRETIGAAMAQAQVTAADIVAIGITNQRETTVVWERATGRPVYNAIVWQDTRTDGHLSRARRGRSRRTHLSHNRPAACHLFRRPQDALDSRQCPQCARPSRSG